MSVLQLFRRKNSPTEVDFNGFGDYTTKYGQLAAALGHPGKMPPEHDLPLLRRISENRAQVNGSLTVPDTLFLAACASIISPVRTIEVGTGTGFSSAILAAMLCSNQTDSSVARVETIDAHTCYHRDEKVPIGFQIPALVPEYASAVRVHTPYESDLIEKLARPNELELGFIDANHQHPCPLLIFFAWRK